MRNEFTLTEMTETDLPMHAKDPIFSNRFLTLGSTTRSLHKHLRRKKPSKEPQTPLVIKQVPPTHYIESRFSAYSQAKVYNKPLFTEISKQIEEISERSLSSTRFRSSRYPTVPLTKELSEKVEKINHFKEIMSKNCRKENIMRPNSNLTVLHKQVKPDMILLNFKSWDRMKKESLRLNRGCEGEVMRESNRVRTLRCRKGKDEIKGSERFESLNTVDTCESGLGVCLESLNRNRSSLRSSIIPY